MKIYILLVAFYIGLTPMELKAANFVVDNFSNGPFQLGWNTTTSNDDLVPGLFYRTRVRGAGEGIWIASSVSDSGIMNYTVDLRTPPSGGAGETRFELYYAKADNSLSFIGSDYFVIRIVGLVGQGELLVGSTDVIGSIGVEINSTGDLIYPLANLRGISEGNLDVRSLVFRFNAKSPDFSITLSEISVIPEPAALTLLTLVTIAFALRHRREK